MDSSELSNAVTMRSEVVEQTGSDPVSNVLKWVLLVVAIATFGLLGWTTVLTYQTAPPFPDRFVTTKGDVLLSSADIQTGKAGFQKADLMDYGSLYGMGSYFGEDYTAQNLVRLAILTEKNIARADHSKKLADLTPEQQVGVKATMQTAERSVYLELILIFLGGVLGVGHHLYWAGEPGMWVPLGSIFSFIEVLPLVLLVTEAIQQRRLIKADHEFKYGLAYIYIIGAAFWNFVGAGVFGGGTLNAPLVNYYEHGTFLTLNHAHTALFGAFGLLGIGLIYFCLRYVAADRYPFGEKMGTSRILALQRRPCALDIAQLLSHRLAATECGL